MDEIELAQIEQPLARVVDEKLGVVSAGIDKKLKTVAASVDRNRQPSTIYPTAAFPAMVTFT